MASIDDTTQKPDRTGEKDGAGVRAVPALSVLWHPDLRRVGEVSTLDEIVSGEIATISRLTPLFFRPGGSEGRPLEDTHLSRTTPCLAIVSRQRGHIEIRSEGGGGMAEVHGAALDAAVRVSSAELERGVVVTLARRIALCLHRIELPVERGPLLRLIGGSDAIENVRRAIVRVADLDVPVLIRGETGTGKEMVARALVEVSRRAGKPFVAVNMAAIPTTTAAAELFGYERGAFTGATSSRGGYFGEAAGGTLFLDEIGLTPPDVQAMLLRVLEAGEVVPLGGGRARKLDVRIVAATDADLERAIDAGAFSEPLFQRLAGFQIALPALRRRRQDMGELLLHFLREELASTRELHKLDAAAVRSGQWLSAAQVAQLALGSWRGNVRALRNAARQIVISSRGQDRATLDEAVLRLAEQGASSSTPRSTDGPTVEPGRGTSGGRTPTRTPWEIDPDALLTALRKNRWSPSATASALNLPRTSLYALMERHPEIRKASTIPTAELLRHYQELGGDLDRMAERLEVSRRGLQLRLAQILQESPETAPRPRGPRP